MANTCSTVRRWAPRPDGAHARAWDNEAWDTEARDTEARDNEAWDNEAWDNEAWDNEAWESSTRNATPRSTPRGDCVPQLGRGPRLRRPARVRSLCPHQPAVGARVHARQRRALLAVVLAAMVALAVPWGGAGKHPLAVPGSAPAGAPLEAHSLYVVSPGDTLWSIAERLDPSGDPRPLVSQMAAQVGSDTISAGERVVLP